MTEEGTYRYFLTLAGGPKREVTKAEWVAAERSAGFRGGRPGEPSTGGFGNGYVNGSMEYVPPGVTLLADLVDLSGGVEEEWSYTYRHHPEGEPGGEHVYTGWEGGDVHPTRQSVEEQLAFWRRQYPGTVKHDVRLVRRTVTYSDWEVQS